MTAMMLLGYDTKATIDFLYDENISEVLRKFEIKVGDLENVSISENSSKLNSSIRVLYTLSK
jgi:hypothetical protein